MNVTRRKLLAYTAAGIPLAMAGARAHAQAPTALKISHQFPGRDRRPGDFRDRLCRKFAAECEKRTQGALKFEIYPGSSLMKINSQFAAHAQGRARHVAGAAVVRGRRSPGSSTSA